MEEGRSGGEDFPEMFHVDSWEPYDAGCSDGAAVVALPPEAGRNTGKYFPVTLQFGASESDDTGGSEEVATTNELDSRTLSRISTFSFNPADCPTAYEIEELMCPSFQWPDSCSTSFASPSRTAAHFSRSAQADSVVGHASVFPAPKTVFGWWKRRTKDQQALLRPAPAHDAHLIRFTLKELQVATGGFRGNILSKSRTGEIHKGRLSDGRIVAVKKFRDKLSSIRILEAEEEMSSIAFPHPNLLRLVGFCETKTENFLIYPYMSNGSVAQCLRDRPTSKPPLDWPTRCRTALGTAKALSYLHDNSSPKIIHSDVKAANIFLDEDFEPFVGGFDIAFLMYGETMNWEKTLDADSIRGTIGHIPPEFLSRGEISVKTDVFAYGIMLLELVTGSESMNLSRLQNAEPCLLLDLVKEKYVEGGNLELLVDPDMQDNYTDAEKLIQIALLCVQDSPEHRPKMSEVVRMLEAARLEESWQEWQLFIMDRQTRG